MTSRTEIIDAQKFLGFWVRVASAVVDSLGFAFVISALLLLFLHFGESLSTEVLLQLFLFIWFPIALGAWSAKSTYRKQDDERAPVDDDLGPVLFGGSV